MKKLTELIAKYGDKEIDETKFKEVFNIKERKAFMPKIGERYWYACEDGCVENHFFYNDDTDRLIIKNSRIFKTKEEAEFERDKRVFMVQMERYSAENSDEIDWGDDNQPKYCVFYSHSAEKIDWIATFNCQRHGTLYTTNKKWLLQYIQDNEADIKKYMFGIKMK